MLQASWVSALPLALLQRLFLVVAVVTSLLVARRLSTGGQRWGDVLRRRFVLGVPWGTLLTVFGVLLVYWVVQGGWENPRNPVVVAFRSWSYFYPLGTIFAGFAHNGVGHITGNLLGTVVLAPIVEYVIGHYPRERGSESFSSLSANPFARILILPAGSILVGLFTGMFSLGPVVGFSGVVFAYAGFAFVTRPIVAVVALAGDSVASLLYRSLRNPYLTREARPGFFTPWWADIAIQGHAIGIVLGAFLGIAVLRHRETRPNPLYLWLAALLYGFGENLWAIYAPLGSDRYALFRAVGVALTFAFAALIASAVTASDRDLLPRVDVSRRKAARNVTLALLLALSAVAVPFGLTTISGDLPDDAETIEIRDYTVTYAENVPNQYASIVDTSMFGDVQVRSSGVIVFSERRRAWIEAVSKGRLSFRGSAAVWVGGIGWRERVVADRKGWSLQGNGSAYKVSLRRDGGPRRLAFRTDPVTASPTIAGRNVSIRPTPAGFDVGVSRGNRSLGWSAIPDAGNETRLGGLTLNRTGRTLYAIRNDTRVQVAKRDVPKAQQDR